jgi:hypothetical protein
LSLIIYFYCTVYTTQISMILARYSCSCFLFFLSFCPFYPSCTLSPHVFMSLIPLQHNTYMPPAEFEPATPVSDRPQTLALDCSTTGIGRDLIPGPSSQ